MPATSRPEVTPAPRIDIKQPPAIVTIHHPSQPAVCQKYFIHNLQFLPRTCSARTPSVRRSVFAILILRLAGPNCQQFVSPFQQILSCKMQNGWHALKINYSSVKIHSVTSQSVPQILERKTEREPSAASARARVPAPCHVRVRVHVRGPRAPEAGAESDVQ